MYDINYLKFSYSKDENLVITIWYTKEVESVENWMREEMKRIMLHCNNRNVIYCYYFMRGTCWGLAEQFPMGGVEKVHPEWNNGQWSVQERWWFLFVLPWDDRQEDLRSEMLIVWGWGVESYEVFKWKLPFHGESKKLVRILVIECFLLK